MREPEIKLFGRKIQVPENAGEVTGDESSDGISDQEQKMQVDEVEFADEISKTKHQDKDQNPNETEESPNPNPSSQESDENPKTPPIEEDIVDSPNNPKSETEQSSSPNEQQKTLKKPDKILPCPRCSSMDTKFCYYNNYNVNQPRHFCKSCQRYWTAGGTMRNVPVGSGRRKNKSSSSHSHHITINEALQASYSSGLHHPSFRANGTVLSFGPDSQMMCEPMALEKRTVKNGHHYKADRGGSVSCKKGDAKNDDCSVGSSSLTNGVKNGFSQPVPWPFPWNSYPIPTFYPHPPPYWNCALPNNAWNIPPWLTVPNQNSPDSPLGKHSRNGELLNSNDLEGKESEEKKNPESSIVVPKTLRIDDPEEAAKSSIWETLGIKYDSAQRKGLFKALQPKRDDKKSTASNSSVLQANPAALSRSITFQEGV